MAPRLVVMVSDDISHNFGRAVRFRAGVQVNDFLPMSSRDILKFEGPTEAFKRAFTEAKIKLIILISQRYMTVLLWLNFLSMRLWE